MLQKQIKKVQWLAIFLMGVGIAMVQLADAKEGKQKSMANAAEQNVILGVLMLLLACFCSGFAGVFTEKVLKQVGAGQNQKKKSVWLQNMQMAFFSMLVCCGTLTYEQIDPDLSKVVDLTAKGVLHGFTSKTWMMVTNNAIGGLLVALVIKYADNILRGFASALAVILTAVISVFTFGFELKPAFAIGALVVVGSTMLYGGIIKMPLNREWWDAEFDICKAQPASSSETSQSASKIPQELSDVKPATAAPV
jgi:UDP-galactose transporter